MAALLNSLQAFMPQTGFEVNPNPWNQGGIVAGGLSQNVLPFQNPAYPRGKNLVETLTPAQVTIVKKRIQRSMRAKRDLGLLDIWDTLEAYYEGKYFKQLASEHQVSVNYMFSIIRQTVAALYFQDPTFYMKGMSEIGRMVAPIMEQVLSYEREVIDAEAAEREFLWHAVLFGIGILKHGYSSAVSPEMPIRDQGMKSERGGDDFELPLAPTVESDQRMRVGHPWTWAIAPHDFFMDPDAKKWTECRWFCHRYNRPYVDVLQDSRLDVHARAQLEPTGKSGFFIDEDIKDSDAITTLRLNNDASICRLYEYYDVQNACVTLMSDNGERPLLYKHYPYLKELTPYEKLAFFESRKHPWGIPFPNTFRSQIEVLNVIRSQQLQHLETWGWTRGAVNVDKLKNRDDAKKFFKTRGPRLLEVHGTDTKITEAVDIFQRQDIPSDSWKISDVHYNDLIDISGANELGARSTETATEASYQEQKHNLRVGDMRYFNDRALKGSARRLIALLKNFWGSDRVVPICGVDGKIWEMFRIPREWVMAEYEVDIEPGSTERIDKVVRTRQIIDAIRELLPLNEAMKQQGVQIYFPELVKKYLENTDVFRTSERVLIPFTPQLVDAQGNPIPQQPGMTDPSQTPAPTSEGSFDAMPQMQDAGLAGRALSEAWGGGAFGGGMS